MTQIDTKEVNSLNADGELMLTILASYAQEESLSVSENQKWRVRKNFEDGMPWNGTMLGYRYDRGTLMVVPEEAKIVKRIFEDYLSGMGVTVIMKKLNAAGIKTRMGNLWCKSSVMHVLRNYAYTGNLLLQKTYRENHLTKRTLVNEGQLPQYHVMDSHEAIISLENFNAVQAEIRWRAEKYTHPGRKLNTYPFTGMLVCAVCGKHYRRKVTAVRPVWICSILNMFGKDACASKQIPEETLCKMAAEVLDMDNFDTDTFHDKITAVRVENDNTLVFCFKNGTKTVKRWKDRSRAESWTEDMKAAARQKVLERRNAK